MKNLLLIVSFWLVPFFGIGQVAEKACFSVPGGFYEESPVLELFPFYQQHHIRFTTNGNRPTAQSRLYTEPLLLDGSLYSTSDIYTIRNTSDSSFFVPDSVRHCIVIRAAVFDANDSCISETATNSYFIQALGCDTHGLPAVSLCADSLDLFDYEHGIFVPGVFFDTLQPQWTGNYYQIGDEWERLANFEFYELNNEGVNQQAGLRTHGGNGRRLQQKSVKLYAREAYGNNRFDHPFFGNIPQSSFKHLVLKPFTSSWNFTGINDYLSCQIAAQLNVESLASRPTVVYLNGEYWGIYFIHERPDERFLEDHLGVDINQVNLISSWKGETDCGSNRNFKEFFHWMENADLGNPEAYAYACSRMDMDCFIDYQIFELFSENTDWPGNNMRCWQQGDGPWRWIFYDGDACYRWMTFKAFENAVYVGGNAWPSNTLATLFFRKLLTSDAFKRQFHTRFLELLNTTFAYTNTHPLFEDINNTLAPEIPFQSERFHNPDGVATWETHMGHTHWFLMKRCEKILPVLEQFLDPLEVVEHTTALRCYPNPTSGAVTLEWGTDTSHATWLEVYDMTGRQVGSQHLDLSPGANATTVELPATPGMYFLKIDDQVIKTIKL